MRSLAERAGPQRFEVIQSTEQFAYCLGLLRPKIVLSSGLVDRLSDAQLQIVLRHEQAHAARCDNLRHWLAALALLPLPRALRRPFLNDLTVASEHACDRAAAVCPSGTGLVVETLAALTPNLPSRARAGATFERATTIESRVRALGRAPRYTLGAAAIPTSIILIYTACAVIATYVAHHATEYVLGWLA